MEEVKKAKAKELAKVKVDKDEVKLVAEQLGVTSHEATAMLKEVCLTDSALPAHFPHPSLSTLSTKRLFRLINLSFFQ